MRRSSRVLVLAIFAIVFTAIQIASYTRTSAVWDEPGHLAAGYAALARGDYRVDSEHPPFVRLWASLPLLAIHGITLNTTAIDGTDATTFALANEFDFTHSFLYAENDADRLLYPARFMIVMLGVLLGVLLFCLVHEWFGFAAAAAALVFYTLEPNIAAHSSLVTTDFGVTCFIFGAIYFLWRTIQRVSAPNLAGLGLFFALALVSKYSALILGPMVLILLAASAFHFRTLKVGTALGILAMLVVSAWIGIWAAYGFRYAPSASPGWLFHFQDNAVVQDKVPNVVDLATWVDGQHLLPNAFTEGFLLGQAKAQARTAFLAGQFSNDGWWYYFPVAFLLKTPISAIVLSLAGLALCLCRWRLSERMLFVLVPIAAYMAAAMQSNLNIGLRHILPIYPFVLVLAAGAAGELIAMKHAAGRVVLAGLALFWIFEVGRAYPNNLAFFNTSIGGPDSGFKYLSDSNDDWGQELKPLKAWMDGNRVAHINLAYFGSADPAYYHVNCTYLPDAPSFAPKTSIGTPELPGYVAVSATELAGTSPEQRDFYAPLRNRAPAAIIGHSMFVYWADRPW